MYKLENHLICQFNSSLNIYLDGFTLWKQQVTPTKLPMKAKKRFKDLGQSGSEGVMTRQWS